MGDMEGGTGLHSRSTVARSLSTPTFQPIKSQEGTDSEADTGEI